VSAPSVAVGDVIAQAIRRARRIPVWGLLILALLAILPYAVVLDQPFISDDYLQIALGRQYGPVSGWSALAADPLYRARATSLVLTYWTERFFGTSPQPFYASAILLHVLSTWLVFALSFKLGLGRRMALCAAAFFAIYEGHQEAVMWYAALPELLVFTFSLTTLILWSGWLSSHRRQPLRYAAALLAFVLALLSKEPAVAVVPLLALLSWRQRRAWPWIAPFALLAIGYFGITYAGRDHHQHFHDGTFSLAAPVALTVLNSIGSLMWFWGLLSLAALALWCRRRDGRTTVLALGWIVVTFLPYSFLTYMPRVPSRHTYMASLGLAWIVAAALLAFRRRFRTSRPWLVPAVAALVLAHNCGYISITKRAQFRARAEPTEALVNVARDAHGPIHVRCFPYNAGLAQLALEMRLGKPHDLVWEVTNSAFTPACLEEETGATSGM
jgi:hypothetical protein